MQQIEKLNHYCFKRGESKQDKARKDKTGKNRLKKNEKTRK